MKRLLLILTVSILFLSCSGTEYDYYSTLNGIVSDYETGNPISNANVMLSPGGVVKITGSDGYFEFGELSPQQYTITVNCAEYITNRKSVNAVSGENVEVNIALIKNN